LETKQHPLKKFYGIGFRFLDLIHYKYNSYQDNKRIGQAKIVFGERFGEYYYRVNVAEKFTYAITCIMISPILGPLTGNNLFSLFGIVAAAFMYYYADTKITDVIKKRENELSRDFADMVSKLALLINAGMITREAWEEISYTGEGTVYEEMRNAVVEMNNGVSEIDAYLHFGDRCAVPFVKKFTSMLSQNLTKGNKELVNFLKAESELSWEEKKHYVKRKGEAASNKMMIPLGMILVGVFVMILVPVLGNLGI
jgi:tight adherence protein C